MGSPLHAGTRSIRKSSFYLEMSVSISNDRVEPVKTSFQPNMKRGHIGCPKSFDNVPIQLITTYFFWSAFVKHAFYESLC